MPDPSVQVPDHESVRGSNEEERPFTVPRNGKLPLPIARLDQIQPLPAAAGGCLHHATRQSRHRRDEAIVLLVLETGMRASEMCAEAQSPGPFGTPLHHSDRGLQYASGD